VQLQNQLRRGKNKPVAAAATGGVGGKGGAAGSTASASPGDAVPGASFQSMASIPGFSNVAGQDGDGTDSLFGGDGTDPARAAKAALSRKAGMLSVGVKSLAVDRGLGKSQTARNARYC
jgi:hypothetical protein